jgi:hypothetical protein
MVHLVLSLSGNTDENQRFYFPKEMLINSLKQKFHKEIKSLAHY